MNNKLVKMVNYAYKEVPMYINSLYGCEKRLEEMINDFKTIPFTYKDELIKNSANAISVRYVPMLSRNGLNHERTSGSSGRYLDIYWDKNDFNKSMFQLWLLRKKYYDISPKDRMCYFYTIHDIDIDMEKDEYLEKNSTAFSKINLSTPRIIEIHKKMCEYRPKWLLLQPSIAVLLCQCIKNKKLDKLDSVEYIEFSGEILTDEVRRMTMETFNCHIANQYGANEFNSISYECPCGNMHVMDSNVYVEVVDKYGNSIKNKIGDICVTTLSNRVMPLIRYKIGDIGMITEKKCRCGNKSSVISLMSGRSNDYILCEDGTKITSYVFVRTIDNINIKMNGIVKQFSIIQKDINCFDVIFVVDMEDSTEINQIEYLFYDSIKEDRLLNAKYKFCYKSELIPDSKTGKFRYFINDFIGKEKG